jgi:hypothetical protein
MTHDEQLNPVPLPAALRATGVVPLGPRCCGVSENAADLCYGHVRPAVLSALPLNSLRASGISMPPLGKLLAQKLAAHLQCC